MLQRRRIGQPGGGDHSAHVRAEVQRAEWAEPLGVLKQSFLAGMRYAVERKQNVEQAGEERSGAVVGADSVASGDGEFDLMQERGEVGGKQWPVLGDDGSPERFGVGHLGASPLRGEPTVAVEQDARGAHVVPEGGAVADPGFVADEHAIKLVFEPAGLPKHHIEMPAGGVKPFVTLFEEAVVELDPRASGDVCPRFERQRGGDVDVDIRVRGGVGQFHAPRAGAYHRRDLRLGGVGGGERREGVAQGRDVDHGRKVSRSI